MAFILEVLIVGLVLSADSFSAAIAMGHRPFSRKAAIEFASASGSAEALMAFLGAIAGSVIIARFSAIDHWIAMLLLAGVALHMGYEGIHDWIHKKEETEELKFHSFKKILLVSFATSLDAFGVGISLGISTKPMFPFIFSIAFWACSTTLIGLYLARKLSEKFGPFMNIAGALVLGYMAIQAFQM